MITRIGATVFFLAFFINSFWPFTYANVVMGIAALVAAVGFGLAV
jgi:hypothetical protein